MKVYLYVLCVLGLLLVGSGGWMVSQANADSRVVVQVPGNTVVQDDAGDFLIRNCDPAYPGRACSLPPLAAGQSPPTTLPPWMDIKTAKITELGGGRVEMAIALQAPVPDPESGLLPRWLAYIWQFEGGCIGTERGPVSKDAVTVVWDRDVGKWTAHWVEIVNCSPRELQRGEPVEFRFSDETVRVRVRLADLMREGATENKVLWYSTVRRMRFVHPPFTQTVPVDLAPNVSAFNPAPPPGVIHPEPPAIWELR